MNLSSSHVYCLKVLLLCSLKWAKLFHSPLCLETALAKVGREFNDPSVVLDLFSWTLGHLVKHFLLSSHSPEAFLSIVELLYHSPRERSRKKKYGNSELASYEGVKELCGMTSSLKIVRHGITWMNVNKTVWGLLSICGLFISFCTPPTFM